MAAFDIASSWKRSHLKQLAVQGPFLHRRAMVCRLAGGKCRLLCVYVRCPGADHDDGRLGVCLLPAVSFSERPKWRRPWTTMYSQAFILVGFKWKPWVVSPRVQKLIFRITTNFTAECRRRIAEWNQRRSSIANSAFSTLKDNLW